MKKIFVAAFTLSFICGSAQILDIPDANFKNALINTQCVAGDRYFNTFTGDVDTNDDGEIELSEALAVQYLSVSDNALTSVAGIENFANLISFNCAGNQLASLDVSMMTKLDFLSCGNNQLTQLNINVAPADDPDDYEFDCSYNLLTSLDLKSNRYQSVGCIHNLLTNINFSAVTSIYDGYFGFNQMASFDWPNQISISYLLVNDNPLTTLSLENVYTWELFVANTTVVSIDLGHNDHQIRIHDNPNLQSLDFQDGSAILSHGQFFTDLYNNPMLSLVCVDDAGNWYYEDHYFYLSEADLFNSLSSSGIAVTPYCTFSPGGEYNIISGHVSFDCGGANIPVASSSLTLTGEGTSTTSTNADGNYLFYAFWGNSTVTPNFENPYFTVSPPSYSFDFTTFGNNEIADFCLTPNGVHPDLEVSIIPVVAARPGFDATYKIVYHNKGTETLSGNVSLDFQGDRMEYVTSDTSLSGQTTNSLTWDFANLAPFQSRSVSVTLHVNSSVDVPAVNAGDSLNFTATVLAGADETPADNAFVYSQVVVGSISPNDKAVSKAEITPAQVTDYLYYTVRFQNLGTAPADNIVVKDLISDKLDLSTFEIVSSSHPCRPALALGYIPQQYLEGNRLEVFFQGIGLPAAADDEPGSHGYVTFKIKPKTSVVLGDIIENKADIYFDYNSPVETNTVTTTVSQLGVAQFQEDSVGIYPNPAARSVTVSVNGGSLRDISIYNAIGQLVLHPSGSEKESATIDISELTAGTYFVKVASDKGTTSKKLIKL